jgi:Leucine-rich repeat (LRR) protein
LRPGHNCREAIMRASAAAVLWLLLAITLAWASASTEGSVWGREADREILVEAARRADKRPDQALLSLQRYVEDRSMQPSPAAGMGHPAQSLHEDVKGHRGAKRLDSLGLDVLLQLSGFEDHAQRVRGFAGPNRAKAVPGGDEVGPGNGERREMIIRHLVNVMSRWKGQLPSRDVYVNVTQGQEEEGWGFRKSGGDGTAEAGNLDFANAMTAVTKGDRRSSGTPTTECTSAMCTFAVDSATGVLSRTGGSACGDPVCQFLSLSGLSFSSIAPGTFDGMSHLVVLDLSNNQLASITHDDFKDLTALEWLVLSRNHLTSIAPGTFAGLHSLQNVSLYNNKLASIEAGTFAGSDGLSAMETFDLSNNRLGFISEGGFEGLSNVRTLKLNHNGATPYSSSGLLHIEDGAFRHMPLLRDLDLRYSNMINISNGTFSGGLVNLETINLQDINYMGGREFRLAPGAFGDLPGLKYLDLGQNYLPQEVFEPGLFRHCSSLTDLRLKNNRLTTLSAELFAGLEGSLRNLDLSSNDITSVSMGALSGFRKLAGLSLHGNDLATLPLEVFQGDLGSEVSYPSSGTSVTLNGNPLVCIPLAPANGLLWKDSSAGSLPQCPSQVPIFIFPLFSTFVSLCVMDVLARMQAAAHRGMSCSCTHIHDAFTHMVLCV